MGRFVLKWGRELGQGKHVLRRPCAIVCAVIEFVEGGGGKGNDGYLRHDKPELLQISHGHPGGRPVATFVV